MIDLIPRHQLGYLLPVTVAETVYYQFHRVFPKDVLLVGYPLKLQAFSTQAVDEALEGFTEGVQFLVAKGVERIVQGGIPVSALAGRARIRALLAQAQQDTGLPVSADFEETIDALKSLGARRVVVAAKWDPTLMDAVEAYLADAGIETLGRSAEAHTAQQVVAIPPREGVDMAVRLGREALQRAPDADALLLAGGAWLSLQAVPVLEAEFGRPVVTNPSATFWAGLRQFGLRSPETGWGRLLDSLHREQPSTQRLPSERSVK